MYKSYTYTDEEWTTEPPTKPGWYWVSVLYPGHHGRHARIIYIDEKQTYYAPIDWDDENREHISGLGNDLRWLGPLPEPEAPKG